MAKISVIVPVYGVEMFLPQCIESILNQTFSDFELILVDDGSPDNCGKMCDQYAQNDKRIIVIHKENEGVSVARNVALEIASGDYITFCDSDDYYRKDWLEKLVTTAQLNDADIVLGNYVKVSETDDIIGNPKQVPGVYLLEEPQDKVHYCINTIFGAEHRWEIWTRLFRADIIREHKIRFCQTCGNFAEDLGFVLEYVLCAKRIVCIEDSGYCYRVRNGSMMQSSKNLVRLDSVNEVGIYFVERAQRYLPKNFHDTLPIFFFLIMYNQYSKTVGNNRFPYLGEEVKKINKIDQWRTNTKAIFHCKCKKRMRALFGKTITLRILLLCRFCLHGKWNWFTIDSAIVYKTHKMD